MPVNWLKLSILSIPAIKNIDPGSGLNCLTRMPVKITVPGPQISLYMPEKPQPLKRNSVF